MERHWLTVRLPTGWEWPQEEELRQLLGGRQELFVKGVRVAGEKCVLVKDELDLEGSHIMNLRTQKNSEGNLFFLSIGKTTKKTRRALTFVKVDKSDKQHKVHVQNSMMGPACVLAPYATTSDRS
ncbi:hypothetical protein fugu_002116 [Takifugu bimaculatus]|uniref:Uncharacterized protein n=1 Tax=Takifugu bimaculatus TaxID=433685 RepID=A0A4Z2BRL8_9TELE|nr:hypothetical protein fugu_002116 [Takifugu bimaculatus]